jgi:hypothetical protein
LPPQPPLCQSPRLRRRLCGSEGFTGVGALLALAVVMIAFLFVCEFFRAYSIKQGMDIELARAANTAADLAMSDLYRQDHLSQLDEGAARDWFYAYLRDDMGLTEGAWEARGADGGVVYALEIERLEIERVPPRIRVSAEVSVRPAFLGGVFPGSIRLPVRASSVNRRKD